MAATLVFIHGLESTSQGVKGQFFRKYFPEMIIEDYIGDFDNRMKKLAGLLAAKNNLILVGSSYGGTMAAQFALQNENRLQKIILLAPALNLPEFSPNAHQQLHLPVVIYHGTNDNIVDPYAVKNIAEKVFTRLEHHLVRDDHSLHNTFPAIDWAKILLRKDPLG
ncbi:MAG: Alpha/beta hydrolase family protein [Smithella sp. PtaU1.Bin162]|nr:MAG: Alpha/beta hydrolase family protein [Smithella sp. PtaU1.Bin162]